MRIDGRLRAIVLGIYGLFLTGCNGGWSVQFAGPFPVQAADMQEFPARHQGVYTAANPDKSLCIGRTAVWRQDRETQLHSQHAFDSLGYRLRADSTYLTAGRLHYLHRVGLDSVRDSWLRTDTIFRIGPGTGHLRRFRGRYYLSAYEGTTIQKAEMWDVERLELHGRQLRWQQLGRDTLRLRRLAPATVHRTRYNGFTYFQIMPASPAETRRVGRYEELWETVGEYDRQR